MSRRHVMTPARRAALRKAQLVSARKRKRRTNVAMYNQQLRRERKTRWQRRGMTALKVAKYTGGTLVAGYATYKMLTPEHRKWVDRKVSQRVYGYGTMTAGRRIRSL